MTDDQFLFVILFIASAGLLIYLVESMRSANRRMERFFYDWQADLDDE